LLIFGLFSVEVVWPHSKLSGDRDQCGRATLPNGANCATVGGAAARWDGGVEELHGDQTVESRSKVWTRGQKCK